MTKYIEIDRAIETALLLLEEGEDEQTLAYNAALVAFVKNMENQSAADVEPRWIPVTERLPEKIGNYLVTCLDGGRQIDLGHWYIDECREGFWSCDWCDADSVIAWMSLPSPYKEGEQE